VLTSAYILAAIRWEEHDLATVHGSNYRFVELPSRSHMVAPGDAAWEQLVREISAFIGWHEEAAAQMTELSAT